MMHGQTQIKFLCARSCFTYPYSVWYWILGCRL